MQLFDKHSLYWKSVLPLCSRLIAVSDPILVNPDSSCGQQLAEWEAEMNTQARAINPMRFDCGMAVIKLQHEDPYRYGYDYLFIEAQYRREQEYYSRPFVFYEWWGTDYETQKRDHEQSRKDYEAREAAILRDLSKRTPYNCPHWMEEDWDREDAELISDWQAIHSFAKQYLLRYLRQFYLYPFSAVYRMDFWIRFRNHLEWWKRRKETAVKLQKHLAVRRDACEAWRKDKAEHAEYVEFLRLVQAVYAESDTTSIYLNYCALKENAEKADLSLQFQLEALRKVATQQVQAPVVRN